MTTTNNTTLSQEEIKEIVNMYKNNFSIRKISEITHYSRPKLTKLLEQTGVKTNKGNHYRKYFFNFDFFETIDNELSAYWLGFIYADGNITKKGEYGEQEFKISISNKDIKLLEHFKKDINSTYPIRFDCSKGLQHKMCLLSMRSQKTVEDLKNKGVVENKSLILEFPSCSQVPQHLLHHFIRGYFDGDGSISKTTKGSYDDYQVSFVGTQKFIQQLYSVLQMGSVFPDKRKSNSWYLSISGNRQIIKLFDYLYKDATRYLDRKYNTFNDLLMKYSENWGI